MNFEITVEQAQMQETARRMCAAGFHVERLWRDARVFAIAPVPQALGLPRSH